MPVYTRMILVASTTLIVGAVHAQDFPSRPIRIITSTAGSGSDFSARQIAQGLTANIGQSVIVENRPSALAADMAAKAQGDGYTLLLDSNSLWLTPLIQKMPYDVLRDFTPVTLASTSPNVFVVYPGVQANSIRELIALAKAKPGTLNYGSTGIGSSQHLAAELFKNMAGVNLVHVPYKGMVGALADLTTGQVHLVIPAVISALPHVKPGRIRALGVTSAEPSPLLPGVPPLATSGLPGFEWMARSGVFAAGKPPEAVISKLNREIVRVVRQPDVKEKFLNLGAETLGNSSAEFTNIVRSEITRMDKVIKAAGIKAD